MVELGQLEKQHREFASRLVRVVVIANDNQENARVTQADFPHLQVVADTDQNLARAMRVIHAGSGRDGTDTNAPTTFLVDGQGEVCWLYRSNRFISRLSPEELLSAIEETWPGR